MKSLRHRFSRPEISSFDDGIPTRLTRYLLSTNIYIDIVARGIVLRVFCFQFCTRDGVFFFFMMRLMAIFFHFMVVSIPFGISGQMYVSMAFVTQGP